MMLNKDKTMEYHCRKMVGDIFNERVDRYMKVYPNDWMRGILFPEREFNTMTHDEVRRYVTFITEARDRDFFLTAMEDEELEMKFFDTIDNLNNFVEDCLARVFPLNGKGNHSKRADMVFKLNAKKYLDNDTYMWRFQVLSYNYKECNAKLYACFWKAIYSGLLYSRNTLKYNTRLNDRITVDCERPIDEPYSDYVGFITPHMLEYNMFSRGTIHMHKVESINRSTYINFVIKPNTHNKSAEKILEFYSINVEKRIQYKRELIERKSKAKLKEETIKELTNNETV